MASNGTGDARTLIYLEALWGRYYLTRIIRPVVMCSLSYVWNPRAPLGTSVLIPDGGMPAHPPSDRIASWSRPPPKGTFNPQLRH